MKNSKSLKIAFLGDISLNGDYKELAIHGTNPFLGLDPLLQEADVVVGNLEAVCKHKEGKHHPKQTRLSIDPASLSLLKHLHLHLVTLANNHIYDNLDAGLKDTLQYLDENGIKYTGAGLHSNTQLPYVLATHGLKIAFLNYVNSSTNPGINSSHPIAINHYDRTEISEQIKAFKASCDFVVLLLHWGVDNSRYPEPWQRHDAKFFVESGADLIVGHHSHVLQGFEKINNAFVFYSLGNFAFAPLHTGTEYELDPSRQQDSVILFWTITYGNTSVHWQPIQLEQLHVRQAEITKIKKISRLIPFISNPIIWPFYSFYLNKLYKVYYYFFGHGRNPLSQYKKIDKSRINRAKSIIGLK